MNVKRFVEALPSTAEYHAYVLRVWRESEIAPWRYSLQLTDGGERRGFATLDQLAAYLHQCSSVEPSPIDRGRDRSDHTPER